MADVKGKLRKESQGRELTLEIKTNFLININKYRKGKILMTEGFKNKN